MPGQPSAKVEKSRCKNPSDQIVRELPRGRNASKSEPAILLLGEVQFDYAALQADRNGVGSIVGAELGQYICYVALDGRFADRELIGNLLVSVTAGNQSQNVDF